MGRIRVATVGSGKIVHRFLEAAGSCPEVKYVAAYSRSQEKAKELCSKYGIRKAYTDLEALARDKDIDAVYIASPNAFHHDQAALMLSHGKHVLVEKPIASNYSELSDMIATAKRNHVVLMEAMRTAYTQGFKLVKSLLPRLGKIRRVTFQYCQYSSRYDNFKKGIIENAFNPDLSNSALMDIGVYCVYTLVTLFGRPESVRAKSVFLSNGFEGEGTLICAYPDMIAEIIYSKITNSYVPSQIQGEDANMLIESIDDILSVKIHYNDGRTDEVFPLNTPKREMVSEIVQWALRIRTDAPYYTNSINCMLVMDEARERAGIRFPADEKAERKKALDLSEAFENLPGTEV